MQKRGLHRWAFSKYIIRQEKSKQIGFVPLSIYFEIHKSSEMLFTQLPLIAFASFFWQKKIFKGVERYNKHVARLNVCNS